MGYLEVFNFTGSIVFLPTNLRHGLESKVLLVVVHQPGGALGDVVEAEGEGDEEDEGSKAEPIPGQGSTHNVASDNAQGCHNLHSVHIGSKDCQDKTYQYLGLLSHRMKCVGVSPSDHQ